MNHSRSLRLLSLFSLLGTTCLQACAEAPVRPSDTGVLAGTWTLVSADVIHPDGSRTGDYGAAPKGRLQIDSAGRYSLQIYATERPRFASGDKAKGTPAEYEAAALGASDHFGTSSVDPSTHTLTLHIEYSSYPNQEGTTQNRIYQLDGDVLSYRVAPRPDGSVPVSTWRRVE